MSAFEQVALDYSNWTGSTSSELGYAVRQEVHPERGMTSIGRHVVPVGYWQQVGVFEADARKIMPDGSLQGPTVLKFQSHNYCIDELSERKTQILAHKLGARVLDLEFPGITMDYLHPFETKKSAMTFRQLAESFMGKFSSLSLLQLRAADAIVDFKDGDEVHLYGESMGANSAVAAAYALAKGRFNKQLQVTDLTLIEPVNASGNRTIGEQLKMATKRLAGVEYYRRLVYLSENTAIGHPITMFEMLNGHTERADKTLKARVGRSLATVASGLGLRKGFAPTFLEALEGNMDAAPTATVMRGRESTVALASDIEALADAAKDKGHAVRLAELSSPEGNRMPAGHSQSDSLGRMAEIAMYMREWQKPHKLQGKSVALMPLVLS